jgi:hypothetical protein
MRDTSRDEASVKTGVIVLDLAIVACAALSGCSGIWHPGGR